MITATNCFLLCATSALFVTTIALACRVKQLNRAIEQYKKLIERTEDQELASRNRYCDILIQLANKYLPKPNKEQVTIKENKSN